MNEQAEKMANAASEAVADTVERIEKAAAECCSTSAEHVRECSASVEEYVRKEPIKSLLIAAGVGFFAALLLRRR